MARRPIPPSPPADAPAPASNAQPRLGMVMRFTPQAAATGVRRLESGGFRVASSRDFKDSLAVPNDFGGADVQYFERFGIAIVRGDSERLKPVLQKSMEERVLSAVRAERSYRPLGMASPASGLQAEALSAPMAGPLALPDYLRGYRDAVDHLVERLLAGDSADTAEAGPSVERFSENSVTWGLQAIKALPSSLSGAGIKVAVLDTGFDDQHPDFLGRAVTKKLFASHSSEDDVHGHGTHCIGTACGPLRPSGVPRYGVAYEAEIYAGKVLGDDGFGTDRSVIAGMDWALEQGCQIISMSLGAATSVGDQPNDDYEQIGQVCLDAGTLVVAAAGNESERPGRINPVGSPANASTILAVGAVDSRYRPAPFSCGGINPEQEVDLAAPGVDVLSSVPGGGHARWDGTSMATPHVAGVAALIAQSNPTFRGWALWARLLQLVRPLRHPARDVGKGLLQAPRR
ncbi:S8 family peptidase [Azohydromonas caseinilytica]|uniref:S8 family serine peptidase n=1 Tax=Azohydromonas caseinilytica TaxID=2728836 RepID=A0A848FAJ8_9BURK|nr:S8 family serine peptidase [Azohydromonas caseinilytica]NML17207.1 S8 family serine peptidase [Azohydromonas caseinilytica]